MLEFNPIKRITIDEILAHPIIGMGMKLNFEK